MLVYLNTICEPQLLSPQLESPSTFLSKGSFLKIVETMGFELSQHGQASGNERASAISTKAARVASVFAVKNRPNDRPRLRHPSPRTGTSANRVRNASLPLPSEVTGPLRQPDLSPENNMHLGSPLRVDATKILSRRELAAVLADVAGKAPRSANTQIDRRFAANSLRLGSFA
jgi:hypothetical protein